LVVIEASKPDQFETAFEAAQKQGSEAIDVWSGPMVFTNPARIVGLAAHYQLPEIYWDRGYVVGGGLMSYGRRERHGARALRANAKRRGLSSKATTSPRPNWYPWCFFIWTRNGPAPVPLSSVGAAASAPALSMQGQRHLMDGKTGSAIVISEPAVMKMPALPALSRAQAGQVRT
jgi:hypothetical protein